MDRVRIGVGIKHLNNMISILQVVQHSILFIAGRIGLDLERDYGPVFHMPRDIHLPILPTANQLEQHIGKHLFRSTYSKKPVK